MKNLAIVINGVLRNKIFQFDKYFRKVFIRNESLVGMSQINDGLYVKESTPEEEEFEIQKAERLIQAKIRLPITSYDLREHYIFDSNEAYENFLSDYTLQIYGLAPQYEYSVDYANFIQSFGKTNNMFKTTLISDEQDRAIIGTYQFLAKNSCKCEHILFVDDITKTLDLSDIIITDNPSLLIDSNAGKTIIKINRSWNADYPADYNFNDLKECFDAFKSGEIKI